MLCHINVAGGVYDNVICGLLTCVVCLHID